jgi:uncharacterized protein YjiS (DUF1127 family)
MTSRVIARPIAVRQLTAMRMARKLRKAGERLRLAVACWHRRRRDRRAIASLDDRGLRDLDLDRRMEDSDPVSAYWRRWR